MRDLVASLDGAWPLGRDAKGNLRVRVVVARATLIVIIDDAADVVVTLWKED